MRPDVVVPGRMSSCSSLGRDHEKALAVRRVQQGARAWLSGPCATRVQQQDRLSHRHFQAPASKRDQLPVDGRKHGDEQPAPEPRPGERLQGLVDPRLLLLRAVAGDLGFARMFETSARRRIHELAQQVEAGHLLAETRRVRDRLQKEKVSRRRSGLNIKHGAGGMLDVYFAARYLQLRDNVPDDGEDRRTPQILRRLRDSTSIDEENFEKMFTGYGLLRSVDHQLRLIIGRSSTVPSRESAAFADMARRLGYETADQLEHDLTVRMKEIRQAYDTIMSVD